MTKKRIRGDRIDVLKQNLWEDHYARAARKAKYPARSVFKLQELQKKYRIIRLGNRILDLGCAPGSWLLYTARETGPRGQVIGIDLKPVTIPLPENAQVFKGDIFNLDSETLNAIGTGFQVVLSDMAPDTTANKKLNAVLSFNLAEAALGISQNVLRSGGIFVCKIFQGADFQKFTDMLKAGFKGYKIFKPKSSRTQSSEIYVIGLGKK